MRTAMKQRSLDEYRKACIMYVKPILGKSLTLIVAVFATLG